ncbi:MAG: TetR/AcrR family transcriptional regulator [Acidimicrobiia bacterium]|nr:TetR/AcrR family transcriptional regulator [Acidimicrobiia bacterium]
MARSAILDSNEPAPGRKRRNRGSEVVRSALINAAIEEFAAHGFEGASTRRMAEAADAHQSQIKYHFDTKVDLWKRCIERLLEDLDAAILNELDKLDDGALAVFEATIRGLVLFTAARPSLSRIMMHEATSFSSRLDWLVSTHTRDRHATLSAEWAELVTAGLVPEIDAELLYHAVIGASTMIYANAPEADLMGINPRDPTLIQRHADTLVALFLRRR